MPKRGPPPAGPWGRRRVASLAQTRAREGTVTVPRAHLELLPDGAEVKLGVFLSNSNRRRAKLTPDKLTALADLGLEWAA